MSAARGWRVAAVGACVLAVLSTPASARQEAVLAGVLVNDATGEPLSGGTVSLIGTDIRVVTDEDGRFLVEGVPEGLVRVRFEAPDHVSVLEDVEASVGAFLRVPLSPVSAVLEEILVRAGSQRARDGAQALAVGRDAEGWRSILDLLAEQVPGVVVRRGGGLGGGAHVSIRGAGTLTGDAAPQIYLDGTLIDSRNTGSWSLHTLDVISAEEVARVRVYKGAASGGPGFALGGANGAIVIETNRGGGATQR